MKHKIRSDGERRRLGRRKAKEDKRSGGGVKGQRKRKTQRAS